MDVTNYLKAGYPALYIATNEPERAINSIRPEGWQTFCWDCMRGIIQPQTRTMIEDVLDPLSAVKWLCGQQNAVFFVQNFHHFFTSVEILQEIQNSVQVWKAQSSTFVMVGPAASLPVEIENYFTMLDFDLPSYEELLSIQKELGESVGVQTNRESVEAALGLTEFEAETAFALSLVEKGRFCSRTITEQKMQMIKRTGLMEFWPPARVEDVGGLDQFKQYVANRKQAFEPGGEHLPKLKALLLVGIPGTGKSLSCKAAASLLGWPLIRLDISSLKGSLVGESERKMRQATATIDAFGRAVVWLDEIDKSFAGVKSSGTSDAGTTSSMFGHFLTWMQETTSPILVMATANNIAELPPEFMRAGRFDAMFFVDLPSPSEREQIIEIMNRRYNAGIPGEYAEKLKSWTGAEIEQLAKDSLFDGLEPAFESIVPLARTMKEEITALRQWAQTRARKANTQQEATETGVRRIRA